MDGNLRAYAEKVCQTAPFKALGANFEPSQYGLYDASANKALDIASAEYRQRMQELTDEAPGRLQLLLRERTSCEPDPGDPHSYRLSLPAETKERVAELYHSLTSIGIAKSLREELLAQDTRDWAFLDNRPARMQDLLMSSRTSERRRLAALADARAAELREFKNTFDVTLEASVRGLSEELHTLSKDDPSIDHLL